MTELFNTEKLSNLSLGKLNMGVIYFHILSFENREIQVYISPFGYFLYVLF